MNNLKDGVRPSLETGLRLKSLREQRKLTQSEVAKIIGVKRSTYTRWEVGTSDPKNYLDKLADFYKVSMDYLDSGKERAEKTNNPDVVRVPVLGRVAAGIPIEAIQEVDDWEEIYHPGAGDDKFFALRIHGQSMEPRLYEGDTVIIRKQDYFNDGDMCVVLVETAATVKLVQKHPDGILLRGYNEAAYRPHFYTAKQVQELPIIILGVVIELRCKP